MEEQKAVAFGLFDNLISTVSGGLIPDIKTAMFACAGLLLIILVMDIITKIITGTSPTAAAADWWEKSGDDEQYSKYKKQRQKKELMAYRYEQEKSFTGPMPKGKGFYK